MKYGKCVTVALMLLAIVVGCSHDESGVSAPSIRMAKDGQRYATDSSGWSKLPPATGLGGMEAGNNGAAMGMSPNRAGQESEALTEPQKKTANTSASNRRVIFESNVEIRVDHFDGIESKVSTLVDRHGGFISNANVSHQVTQSRTGHWTIRVPVTAYRQLIDSVGTLGEVESRKEIADDVTAEFYDLEARIKNKQLLEQRIAKLLDETKSELRKMIEVERELARVREEVERMQGRLRYLADVTGMSTLHLRIKEKLDEPAPAVAATFSDRVSKAWNSAVTQATNTAQNLIVVFVENIFRWAVAAIILLFVWLAARMIISRANRRAAATAS